MNKPDLALDKLHCLVCHKTKTKQANKIGSTNYLSLNLRKEVGLCTRVSQKFCNI